MRSVELKKIKIFKQKQFFNLNFDLLYFLFFKILNFNLFLQITIH
jgi:hypothetical protein